MVSNSKPLTAVSTNGKIIRPTGSMMLATTATHRSLVTTGCFAMLSPTPSLNRRGQHNVRASGCKGLDLLLRRRADGDRPDRRAGRPLRAQRQDDGAGEPDLVGRQRGEIGVLDIVDAGLRQIVVMDGERQGGRSSRRRRRLALQESVRDRIGEWIVGWHQADRRL